MNILLLNFLVSLTILPAAIIALWRYRRIDRNYYPIIWLWISIILNESIRYAGITNGYYSLLGYNIWILLAGLLYTYQFYRWNLFRKQWLCYALVVFLVLLWVTDHFLLPGSSIHSRQSYFRLILALVLVILSITCINKLIIAERSSLLKNSRFLICVALAVYYTFRILCDAFSLQGMSPDFLNRLANFNRYVLQFMYLLYLLAALWMPKKRSFILPS